MALIPGFEYDIFISYAHVDNATFSGQEEGWIKLFYAHLKQMLDRRYGRMGTVKIWWDDKKLDGTKLFDESIKNGIAQSAIFLVLNSPGYKQSDYCQQELDLFQKKVQNDPYGLQVADRSRIVHVLLNNIPYEEWPTPLRGTTGFSFHDAREKEDFGDLLETDSKNYISRMQDLRDGIWELINDLRREREERTSNPTTVTDAFTIYIGEVPDTLRTSRKRIISELEKKGYEVITGIPPPDEVNAHQESTEEAIKKSDLTVHLLDQYPGREIIGAPQFWYPQKQAEIALGFQNPQMIWVPSELDFSSIEELEYQRFLSDLEAGKGMSKGVEFIRGPKSLLAKQIADLAEQIKLMEVENPSTEDKLSVLLDTHLNDQNYAFDLGKALLDNNIQPFINPQEDDPRKNIEILGNRIGQVKKLIFLYGKVSREWVLERMSAALQLIITRNYPIEDFLIYMAPPHKEDNDLWINQKFLKINIIDNSNQQVLDGLALEKFIKALKPTGV